MLPSQVNTLYSLCWIAESTVYVINEEKLDGPAFSGGSESTSEEGQGVSNASSSFAGDSCPNSATGNGSAANSSYAVTK